MKRRTIQKAAPKLFSKKKLFWGASLIALSIGIAAWNNHEVLETGVSEIFNGVAQTRPVIEPVNSLTWQDEKITGAGKYSFPLFLSPREVVDVYKDAVEYYERGASLRWDIDYNAGAIYRSIPAFLAMEKEEVLEKYSAGMGIDKTGRKIVNTSQYYYDLMDRWAKISTEKQGRAFDNALMLNYTLHNWKRTIINPTYSNNNISDKSKKISGYNGAEVGIYHKQIITRGAMTIAPQLAWSLAVPMALLSPEQKNIVQKSLAPSGFRRPNIAELTRVPHPTLGQENETATTLAIAIHNNKSAFPSHLVDQAAKIFEAVAVVEDAKEPRKIAVKKLLLQNKLTLAPLFFGKNAEDGMSLLGLGKLSENRIPPDQAWQQMTIYHDLGAAMSLFEGYDTNNSNIADVYEQSRAAIIRYRSTIPPEQVGDAEIEAIILDNIHNPNFHQLIQQHMPQRAADFQELMASQKNVEQKILLWQKQEQKFRETYIKEIGDRNPDNLLQISIGFHRRLQYMVEKQFSLETDARRQTEEQHNFVNRVAFFMRESRLPQLTRGVGAQLLYDNVAPEMGDKDHAMLTALHDLWVKAIEVGVIPYEERFDYMHFHRLLVYGNIALNESLADDYLTARSLEGPSASRPMEYKEALWMKKTVSAEQFNVLQPYLQKLVMHSNTLAGVAVFQGISSSYPYMVYRDSRYFTKSNSSQVAPHEWLQDNKIADLSQQDIKELFFRFSQTEPTITPANLSVINPHFVEEGDNIFLQFTNPANARRYQLPLTMGSAIKISGELPYTLSTNTSTAQHVAILNTQLEHLAALTVGVVPSDKPLQRLGGMNKRKIAFGF
ncbi:MAG: hypothetical protein ACOYK8_07960 [Alphaproteobacteria bacterium]